MLTTFLILSLPLLAALCFGGIARAPLDRLDQFLLLYTSTLLVLDLAILFNRII